MSDQIKPTDAAKEVESVRPRKLEIRKKAVRTLTEAELTLVGGGRQGSITYIDSCGCSFGCSIGCGI